MQQLLSSSSSSNPSFALFSTSPNPNHLSKFTFKIPILPRCSSRDSSTQLLDHDDRAITNAAAPDTKPVLVVRRPEMELPSDEAASPLDVGVGEFAKKIAIFEPDDRAAESNPKEKPLKVNLDLALYRAKILTRNYRYAEAQELLEKCICYWPEDGRAYVALGKALSRQSKMAEARAVYEKGCQATQGENPFIWQCWAVLEDKVGNTRRARGLFDAATVADKKHIAAWHGWGVLELKQGNISKARHLLAKGLKFCGGNEYIYQTLARLEAKASRYEQARYLFRQATRCNPKSCASWLAWAQMEMQQENNPAARRLFEKSIQASPKNRFAWHVWGLFETKMGNVEKGRKLLKIGHTLNPRDPVLLQSLALLEYEHSTANVARQLFRRASELDPRHQPVWTAWGWMEWKEGNIATARKLYQKALSINSTSETAARCLQAWGVLEERNGNLSAARRLFRSSLNINSQSYVTWMTWASLEENQGNSARAEEIRDLYFQQRTEVVDDPSWVMGLLDIIDPALDRIRSVLNLDQASQQSRLDSLRTILEGQSGKNVEEESVSNDMESDTGFDVDAFCLERLSLDPSKLQVQMVFSPPPPVKRTREKVFK
ncbi:protein high chlorophyll fluorescent 107 [Argentina anserina]|uniref:protein high chlorophyll fluorescent 107 n=1 Tax=Argentina anserina TaxID=57926 RepID=UPI002176383E|nr:protein high chlorophyll fluorescent 107 [Potentilla anserina]